jgi:hypothetical protein
VNHSGEYRYSPPEIPGPSPEHDGCYLTRCRRFLCPRPVHVNLRRRGQPRRYYSPACRIAEYRRLAG